jgi:uncharacterized protein YggT (Ycf19 family)
MEYLFGFIFFLLQGMRIFLVLGTLLPMVLPSDNTLRKGIERIIEPVLRPFRKIIKPIGGFDITPLALYLLLIVLESLVRRLLLPLAIK